VNKKSLNGHRALIEGIGEINLLESQKLQEQKIPFFDKGVDLIN
jgi:hypothetical protein